MKNLTEKESEELKNWQNALIKLQIMKKKSLPKSAIKGILIRDIADVKHQIKTLKEKAKKKVFIKKKKTPHYFSEAFFLVNFIPIEFCFV